MHVASSCLRALGEEQISACSFLQELPALNCVEFFCGVASLARAWKSMGYQSKGFDILRGGPLHDLCHPLGVMTAIAAIMCMETGGWGHLAVCCTSFCWINSGTHARSAWRPQGDDSRPYVQLGTRLAAASSALATLLWLRGHLWSMENPVNSTLEQSEPLQYLVRWLRRRAEEGMPSAKMHAFTVSLGDFGAASLKPVWVYASEDLTDPLTAMGNFSDRQSASSSEDRPQVTIQTLGSPYVSLLVGYEI